jgi:hypothetical protein
MIEVRRYQLPDGGVPLSDWLAGLRDARVRARHTGSGHQEGQGVLAGLEEEKQMSRRKQTASVPHIEATIAELRADRAFAVEYRLSRLCWRYCMPSVCGYPWCPPRGPPASESPPFPNETPNL